MCCYALWILVVFAVDYFSLVSGFVIPGKQVVLLDTTLESSLEWTRYPYGPQARTPGWVEESFTNFEQGINWRSYVVCDVAYNSVNNWLWTPFIERQDANRMYIEVKFSMRDCNLFPGMALSCKETFSLLYYEFDAATKEPPPWEPDSYKLIDRIAADEGRFTSTSEVIINTEVRSVPITKKGVYFAFRDQGACLSLIAIKVFYITCPSVTLNFAYFPETPTGHELSAIVSAEGQCVANTAVVDTPRLLCKGDGNWTLPSGGCKCVAGYEPVDQSCQLCSPGTYKEGVGDELCMPCPLHSTASYSGSVECQCDNNYFRSPKDPKSMPCTEPPSKPLNLSETFVDQSSVLLSWLPPRYLGGRNDTFYRVSCDKCGTGVTYIPSQQGFSDTKVTVTGLSPVTTYTFKVYAENGVTSLTTSMFAEITITTDASVPSLVSNVRIKSVKSSEIHLEWDPPSDPFAVTENYELRYFPKGNERNGSTLTTTKEELVVKNLKEETLYGFQVRAKTTHGWGDYSKTIYKMTGAKLATRELVSDDQVQVPIIAGVAIAVIVLVIVVIVIIVLYIRRSSDDCNKKQPSDCDTLEYRNGEVVPALVHPPIVPTAWCYNEEFSDRGIELAVTTPLFTQCGAARAYIDPHTYEDPNQAVREFTKEIDASHITIESIIGGGEFGDVCKGRLKLQGQTEVTVAIKTLKPSSSDKARMDFLTEASIMGQFDHPNVIYLQGVVTKSNPVMIITEFMENGSLDTFLRANDGKFQVIQLVGMLRGIAAGMQYLAEMNYVHRDLAARNVLVNGNLICKIADFGLSREIESATEGAYTTRGGKIPVRWTAPEAIAYRKFTSASDVWSFGIVFWEVMSYGERPYWNWSNQDVIKSIEKGYRLPAPMDCPEALHQLMLDCWQKERAHRPTFAVIVKTLDKLMRCPESLKKIAQNRPDVICFDVERQSNMYEIMACKVDFYGRFKHQNPLDPNAPDMTQFKTVDEWLNAIKMNRYQENFQQAGITTMDAVTRITLKDLTALGVSLVGHQKKIINSIQTMRAQLNANMSEGFLV